MEAQRGNRHPVDDLASIDRLLERLQGRRHDIESEFSELTALRELVARGAEERARAILRASEIAAEASGLREKLAAAQTENKTYSAALAQLRGQIEQDRKAMLDHAGKLSTAYRRNAEELQRRDRASSEAAARWQKRAEALSQELEKAKAELEEVALELAHAEGVLALKQKDGEALASKARQFAENARQSTEVARTLQTEIESLKTADAARQAAHQKETDDLRAQLRARATEAERALVQGRHAADVARKLHAELQLERARSRDLQAQNEAYRTDRSGLLAEIERIRVQQPLIQMIDQKNRDIARLKASLEGVDPGSPVYAEALQTISMLEKQREHLRRSLAERPATLPAIAEPSRSEASAQAAPSEPSKLPN